MVIKQKSPSLSRNLALRNFGKVLIAFSTKVNLLYLPYSTTWRCSLLHLIKQNFLLKIPLPVSPSKANQKLHNISATPKMVKKIITKLHLSKASGPDCILVVVLKNCEPELSYILADLFNKCLKKSCFPDCWKVLLVVPVKTAKSCCPVSLLFVVNKVFKTIVNNRIVDHQEKYGLFSDFQYGFSSSRSTADLLTVAI